MTDWIDTYAYKELQPPQLAALLLFNEIKDFLFHLPNTLKLDFTDEYLSISRIQNNLLSLHGHIGRRGCVLGFNPKSSKNRNFKSDLIEMRIFLLHNTEYTSTFEDIFQKQLRYVADRNIDQSSFCNIL